MTIKIEGNKVWRWVGGRWQYVGPLTDAKVRAYVEAKR